MKVLRIGTRDSQLAVWQATLVQSLLKKAGVTSELVYIKSEGDIDTVTPLYELGVQGIFTKTLDAALLSNRIDVAVHSMKDVPTLLAHGIQQAAVLKRASHKDILVYKEETTLHQLGYINGQWHEPATGNGEAIRENTFSMYDSPVATNSLSPFTIATSSIRRIAQWKHRFPQHQIENLRGNVNTRLRKVQEHNWQGAIFAAAGLERIHLRPQQSVDLNWMLPAPAQGAIMVVCREDDKTAWEACQSFHDSDTALCTAMERDFLKTLMGGCSTPISALAEVQKDQVFFKGNICSPDGTKKVSIEKEVLLTEAIGSGVRFANELINQPSAALIVQNIRNAKK